MMQIFTETHKGFVDMTSAFIPPIICPQIYNCRWLLSTLVLTIWDSCVAVIGRSMRLIYKAYLKFTLQQIQEYLVLKYPHVSTEIDELAIIYHSLHKWKNLQNLKLSQLIPLNPDGIRQCEWGCFFWCCLISIPTFIDFFFLTCVINESVIATAYFPCAKDS